MTEFKSFVKRKKCSHINGFSKKCKCKQKDDGYGYKYKTCRCPSVCRDCGITWAEYIKILDARAYKAAAKAKKAT